MTLRSGWLLPALLGPFLVLPAAPALAAGSDTARTEARERFDRGLTLFNQGDNQGAIAEFQRAYQLTGNATVLYNIARVQAAAGEPVAALATLERLAQAPNDLSPARKAQAEQLAQEQQKRVGTLRVTANVASSQLEVDGIDSGALDPSKPIVLSAGRHVVGVLSTGYQPSRQTLLIAGQEQKTLNFKLEPLEGQLGHVRLQVEPLGVSVLLDGLELGKTPQLVELAVAPGKHQLELKRPGYRSVAREVTVPESGALDVGETLVFDPASRAGHEGQLSVRASETDAVVFINGAVSNEALRGVALPEGQHRLRVERQGFVTSERLIVVPSGSEAVIDVTLAPTAQYRADYASAASARRSWALGLGAGGFLLAGASAGYLAWNGGQISDAQDAYDGAYADAKPACDNHKTECGKLSDIAGIREEDLSKKKDRQIYGWVGVGVGAAALGTGVVLWLTGNDPHRYDPKPESDVFGSLQLVPLIGPETAGFLLTRSL